MLQYRNQQEKSKSIAVFYHLYIPDLTSMWVWWVNEQMGLLKSTCLFEKAKINVCITLPFKIKNLVIEYIKSRYSFVNILDLRDTNEQNIFEMQTLSKIHEYSQSNDSYILYFHNKGITSYMKDEYPAGTIDDWRKYIQYFLIEKYKECIKKLELGYDYVSVDEIEWEYKFGFSSNSKYRHLNGNFWWSTTNYIKNLGNPVYALENYENAVNHKVNFNSESDFGSFYRLSSEMWIHLNKPKCLYLYNSNINNYFEYYPRQRYAI
jgi:hypothetical protein